MNIDGKVALITGASQGIGAACARVFAARGVTDPQVRARAIAQTVERFGRIDVLINSDAPLEDVRRMFELNVFAMLGMVQLAVPQMRRQGEGVIVNIGSLAGKVTLPWLTLYSASKYAAGSMTVCLGCVRTAFFKIVIAGQAPPSFGGESRFSIDAGTCAEAVARGVERRARTVVTPRAGGPFILGDFQLTKIYDNSRQA